MSVRKEFIEKVPPRLDRLVELVYNLWWSWNSDARKMFQKLDPALWHSTNHNPLKMLRMITKERLEEQVKKPRFLRLYDSVCLEYDQIMDPGAENLWWTAKFPGKSDKLIGYMSMEYGVHQSLPIYSGGLGVLSGDHLKEASDLGIPLVAIGFLYEQGYFLQQVPLDGWQVAVYKDNDFAELPIEPVMRDGKQLHIEVELNDHVVYAKIWHVQVGRISLYLLDTNFDKNAPWDRDLSDRLYGGDQANRLKQEIILGVGGVKAFRLLGFNPDIWHLNEGHCAISLLERVRELVERGSSFDEAIAKVRKTTVFTTHTPVPAGHDAFNFAMVSQYFRNYCEKIGISMDQLLALGRFGEGQEAKFNLTALSIRMSRLRNSVSKIHGQVANTMMEPLWKEMDVDPRSKPIIPIVNGVHVPTWVPSRIRKMFTRWIDPKWMGNHDDPLIWEKIYDIPDSEIWKIHQESKKRLFRFMREKIRRKRVEGQMESEKALISGALFDPEVLTIGFARRFATYKRATLVFTDFERLKKILMDPYKPVQIIFSGKAHPADDPAKYLIQKVIQYAKSPELGNRIAFIEDYDLEVGKFLVQGVDLWLNNPLKPNEASGTSGMKAAMNFIPNFSILDGWWAEGYTGKNGWAIGDGSVPDRDEQDRKDADSIYRTLENEIVPLFYDVDSDGLPRGWIEIMRESVKTNLPKFSMRRMLKQYSNELYTRAMDD
ncbi:MAG: alpha-glucan family phosphorylase [Candidatus Hodarchaeales archaeon]